MGERKNERLRIFTHNLRPQVRTYIADGDCTPPVVLAEKIDSILLLDEGPIQSNIMWNCDQYGEGRHIEQ